MPLQVPPLSCVPNPAYTDDELVVSAYGSTDGDGDTVSYLYSWYKDGPDAPNGITIWPPTHSKERLGEWS